MLHVSNVILLLLIDYVDHWLLGNNLSIIIIAKFSAVETTFFKNFHLFFSFQSERIDAA